VEDSIKIALKRGIWSCAIHQIRVRADRDSVLILIADKMVSFTTPAAHRAGFSLVKLAGRALPGEFVIMSINGSDLDLLPEHALKVGGALLRKADDVDDYQLRKNQ